MAFDVSIILNLHAEGDLATATFESILKTAEIAKYNGISCELIAVVDRGNHRTIEICKKYSSLAKIIQCEFGDLSQSRNFGINHARGFYSTFIDGDDLWGHDWIYRSYALLDKFKQEKMIVHPQTNLFFGRAIRPYFWVHPDMRYDSVSYDDILSLNRWTALSFAKTQTYKDFPYHENAISRGFGYEDWLWNIETAHSGYLHVVAKKTIHFIRKKSSGSLLQESKNNHVLPNISKLINFNALKMTGV